MAKFIFVCTKCSHELPLIYQSCMLKQFMSNHLWSEHYYEIDKKKDLKNPYIFFEKKFI